uniref:MaoC-like domain-containing protein n=1 Tax=Arcella intermedia TaxID=1963864 RepID=A0A6B2LCQ6_9EUKA
MILYAIGIGCDELKYVYENDDNFAPFPTYPIVLGFKGKSSDVQNFPSEAMVETTEVPALPGTKVLLDGERYLEVVNPLPTEGEFTLKNTVIGISKRGQGALVESETTISDKDKTYVKIVSGAFFVGAKDFEPEKAGKSYSENVNVPQRSPDVVEEVKTLPNQAQIYRLSGDYNPLHVDPNFARMSNFKQPILHGLCTFGHAAHSVIKNFAGNDPALFKSIKARFSKPVNPGETLVISMWKEGNKVIFEVKVKETNAVVVNNAYVLLNGAPAAKL